MIEPEDGREVEALNQGAAIDDGEAVRFDVLFTGGSIEPFHATWANFRQFTSQLHVLGAEVERRAQFAVPTWTKTNCCRLMLLDVAAASLKTEPFC